MWSRYVGIPKHPGFKNNDNNNNNNNNSRFMSKQKGKKCTTSVVRARLPNVQ